ncbi:unnamed protein product, partial [marine sediment metagenome]
PVDVAETVIPDYVIVSITGVGGYAGWITSTAVTSVVFSPSWSGDRTVLVITVDDLAPATYLQTGKWGTSKYWNKGDYPPAVELKDAEGDPIAAVLSGIALPSDYSGFDGELRTSWVFVNIGDGEVEVAGIVRKVENARASETCSPTGDPELASIAYHGTVEDGGKLMLGVLSGLGDCAGIQVFRTDDFDPCCPAWRSCGLQN